MNISTNLSFEQEFNLRVYQEQVKQLDLPAAQELLLEILQQSMIKDNLLKNLIKSGM
jgi:Phycobilisome degradation protein nblA